MGIDVFVVVPMAANIYQAYYYLGATVTTLLNAPCLHLQ